MMRRRSESGNIFFMLFGAVALVGVVAAATSTLMRGPLSTVVNVNARAKADTQMQIAAKLAMVRAAQQPLSGDCDSDGNIEPIAAFDATPKPAGGGQLPSSIGASGQDPWGDPYGYCVWDIGTKNNDPTCAVDTSAPKSEVARLKGDYNNNYPVMVIISAGPDRTFQTQCNDWNVDPAYSGSDPVSNNYPTNFVGTLAGQHTTATVGDVIYKPITSDDIILSYTYDQASQVAGGLWALTKSDPNKITTNKDVDIQTNANFASGKTATFQGAANFDTGAKLDLGFGRSGVDSGGLFKLPDNNSLSDATCSGINAPANDGALRLRVTGTHNALEVCDGKVGGAGWTSPSASGLSVSKIDDLTDAVASFSSQSKNIMLGDGTGLFFTSTSAGLNNVMLGVGSAASLGSGASNYNNVIIGSNTATSLTGGSQNILIGSNINVPTASTSGFLSIGNMIYATGMNGTGTTVSAGNVGIGTASPNVRLDVAGTVQGTQFQFNSSNALAYSSGNITLSYGGSNELYVNGNGVGIGTAATHSPSMSGKANLDVNGDAYADRFIAYGSSVGFTFDGDATTGISHPSSGTIGLTLGGAERAVLTSTGLGIGTTSPSSALDVVGDGEFSGFVTSPMGFNFSSGGSSSGLYNVGGNVAIKVGAGTSAYFSSSGVGIGTANPLVMLDINGAARIANTNAICDASIYGAIRYSSDTLEYCASTPSPKWSQIISNGGGGGSYSLWTDYTTFIGRYSAFFVNSGIALPATLASAGSRFFWYPDKSTFRAGGTSGSQWSDASIGNYSMGLGYDTKASGDYSFAGGQTIDASGANSVAIGESLTASGTNAVALGYTGIASGNNSIMLGQSADATGVNSVAVGLGLPAGARPVVSGARSFGIFMGDQSGRNITSDNTMELLGGKFLIDANPQFASSTTIGGLLTMDVNGDVGAEQYCDSDGAYCFTAQSVASGAVGVFENSSNVIRLTSGTVNYSSASFVFGSPSLADDGIAGHRNRFFYDKSSGAFRAGGTSSTAWNTVGGYSTGLGYDTIATGNFSTAIGRSVQATGTNSVGYGLGTAAGTAPNVSGASSYGIFMGDQSGVNFASANAFGIFGGKMVIDPKVPATQLYPRGVLDLGAATDAMVMPVGTTAQRPVAAASVNGMIRYNNDNGKFEAYQGGLWLDILTSGGGALTAAGSDTQIQFNSGGFLGAMSGFTWDRSSSLLFISGKTNMGIANSVDGDLTVANSIKVVPGGGGLASVQLDNSIATGSVQLTLKNSGALGRTWAMQVAGNNNGGTGGTGMTEGNFLLTDGGTTSFIIMKSSGNVGIGSFIPVTKLEVPGTIKISDGGESCSSTYKGAIRYTSLNTLQYCNSTAWTSTAAGTGVMAIDDLTDAITKYSSSNMYLGQGVGAAATTGISNTALGSGTMQGIVSGSNNVAMGTNALSANTSGGMNVAVGANALALSSSAGYNTAVGFQVLYGTSGTGNTGIGASALTTNSTGTNNVAVGSSSLQQSTVATGNTVIGYAGMFSNIAKSENTAIGYYAMQNADNSTTPATTANTAIGAHAMQGSGTPSNNTGMRNTVIGYNTLLNMTSASDNTVIGYNAGSTTTTGTSNILIGSGINASSSTASNEINIGNFITGNMGTGLAYVSATGALKLPVGTTLQTPSGASAVNGMIRYDSNKNKFQGYQAGTWQDILTSGVSGGAAAPDRGIQFNSGNNFAASSDLIYTSAGAFMVSGTAGTISLPASGAGTRMFFDPNSAAFRVGKVSGTQWDSANVGTNSIAFGNNTIASGTGSVAIGATTTASGTKSLAFGDTTTASGVGSIAGGVLSYASGPQSIAFGYNNVSSGDTSIALGWGTVASGATAISIGNSVVASGANATSIGYGNTSSGINSIAMGSYVKAGNGTAGSGLGNYSMAIGLTSTNTTQPQVTGTNALGVFMGNQAGVVFASSNSVGFFGGNILVDPRAPATQLKARGVLDLGAATDAVVMPAGTSAQKPTGTGAVNGMIRYNTDNGKFEAYQAGLWQDILTSGGGGTVLDDLGDVITQYASSNMYLGQSVGAAATGGQYNTALGTNVMQAAVSGSANTAVGESALVALTTGGGNTAYGSDAMSSTSTGSDNVALGFGALNNNQARGGSTAVGMNSMNRMSNSTGAAITTYNTAVGWYSMLGSATPSNNTGVSNTAVGSSAMQGLTSGNENTAFGNNTLFGITSGSGNTALGTYTLQSLTSGGANIGVGNGALGSLNSGGTNIAVGNGTGNTLTTGSGNLLFGSGVDVPLASTSNYMTIGNLIFGSGGFGTGTAVGAGRIGIRTASPRVTFDITGTDAIMIPAGTTANRPGTSVAVNGMIRYNATLNNFEGYQNGSWLPFSSASASATAAAGLNTQIQYNSAGILGASAGLTFTSGVMMVSGTYRAVPYAPASGNGSRMFFDPAGGAFRAGVPTTTAWDTANIGKYSFAGAVIPLPAAMVRRPS